MTTFELLEPHVAFFTWAENYGSPDCRLPVSDRFQLPADASAGASRPLGDDAPRRRCLHDHRRMAAALARRDLQRRGLSLEQALRVPEVPRPAVAGRASVRAGPERATTPPTRPLLEEHGWRVRDAGRTVSTDLDPIASTSPVARRVHRRQGPERAAAQRLVQRPQRHVSRRRAACRHPGDRFQQRRCRPGCGLFGFSSTARSGRRHRFDRLGLRPSPGRSPRHRRRVPSTTASSSRN